MGPNVKKLIAYHMSTVAIPPGGGLQAGLNFLNSKEKILNVARESTKWVKDALEAVRLASDPNPWRNADDESIAGELLRKIAERKHKG